MCTGGTGSVIAAICCFTPILAVVPGALRLSAWLGGIDYVLFPALALFLGITIYGRWWRQRAAACGKMETTSVKEAGHD
ncbi:MAG: mercury resistance system transport protein MerF [Burkholderiales bacterium]